MHNILSLFCLSLFLSLSGYGVKKISAVNLKASQYVPIHVKQIRGLAFNKQQDSLLLSAALDNTVKLTRYATGFALCQYFPAVEITMHCEYTPLMPCFSLQLMDEHCGSGL